MNAMTPAEIDRDRSILELLAKPELLTQRANALLDAITKADAATNKSLAAKAEADKAMKDASDTLTQMREMQTINTTKSALLTKRLAEVEEQARAMAAEKADDVKRLGEWEQRLKAQHDAQATMQAEIDRQVNEAAAARVKLDADLADAEAIFTRAQAIKAAME